MFHVDSVAYVYDITCVLILSEFLMNKDAYYMFQVSSFIFFCYYVKYNFNVIVYTFRKFNIEF